MAEVKWPARRTTDGVLVDAGNITIATGQSGGGKSGDIDIKVDPAERRRHPQGQRRMIPLDPIG